MLSSEMDFPPRPEGGHFAAVGVQPSLRAFRERTNPAHRGARTDFVRSGQGGSQAWMILIKSVSQCFNLGRKLISIAPKFLCLLSAINSSQNPSSLSKKSIGGSATFSACETIGFLIALIGWSANP